MKVIVDNKIPYIREAIEQLADEVVYLPGKAFTPEVVKDANALIIRTRTICNRELLEGSNVRFIGTATIGFDHIDGLSGQPPSASTTLIRNIASKPGLPGATAPDAMRGL